jgi:guanylate kinase
MKTKFLAMMGPSGVGKNTIMNELVRMDPGFVVIKTHVTRPLREGETDRVSLSIEKLREMRRRDEVLPINPIYSAYYAALPRKPIERAFEEGKYPMCDYKIAFAEDLKNELEGALFCVYLLPPNPTTTVRRLEAAGRKANQTRLIEDSKEMMQLSTKYKGLVDLVIVNPDGKVEETAKAIRKAYLNSLQLF